MRETSRWTILKQTTLAGSLVCALDSTSPELLLAQTRPEPRYDLLIRDGRVIDPSQKLSAERDIGIVGQKIAAILPQIPESEARQTLDARGKIVTPGLIDIHAHVYDGVAPLCIPADANSISKGVTTVVDAGSSGAHTFPGFKKYVINVVDTRVYALLNISVVGQSTLSTDVPWGELLDLRYANPRVAIKTIEQNRDVILGVKIRLTNNIAGDHDLEALKLAREAADAVKLPIMAHIGGTHAKIEDIVAMLKKGDVMTHSFRGDPGGILDSRGRVIPRCEKLSRMGCISTSATVPGASRLTLPKRPCGRASRLARFRATCTRATTTAQCSIWRPRSRSFSYWG
jgi:dihydroorotase